MDVNRIEALEEQVRALQEQVAALRRDDAPQARIDRLDLDMDARGAETKALILAVYEILDHLGIHDPILERQLSAKGTYRYSRITARPSRRL